MHDTVTCLIWGRGAGGTMNEEWHTETWREIRRRLSLKQNDKRWSGKCPISSEWKLKLTTAETLIQRDICQLAVLPTLRHLRLKWLNFLVIGPRNVRFSCEGMSTFNRRVLACWLETYRITSVNECLTKKFNLCLLWTLRKFDLEGEISDRNFPNQLNT